MKIMQEQPHYNITPEGGWSKMKPILDVEMPVSSRPRRYIFFWWTATAILTTGLIGLFLYKGSAFLSHPAPAETISQVAPTPPNEIKSQIMVEEQNAPSTMTISSGSETASPVIAAENIKAETKIIPSGKASAKKPDASSNPSNRAKSKQNKNSSVPMAYTGPADVYDKERIGSRITVPANVEPQTKDNSLVERSTVADHDIGSPDVPLREEHLVAGLPVLLSTPLEIQERMLDDIRPNLMTKVKRSRAKIEPSVAVGGFSGEQGGAGGYAMAGADLRVSKRFSVSTFLGHRSFKPGASFLGLKSSRDDYAFSSPILNQDSGIEGVKEYLNGDLVNVGTSSNAIVPFVETVRQWQVSAGVQWSLTKRFFTEGGIHFGFNTKAFSEYPIVTLDITGSPLNGRINNSLNSYDVVRSTMTSVYGGAGYRIGKHFDVLAHWTHSFNTYLQNGTSGSFVDQNPGSRTDYIRGLNLGLRYTL
jgi:hypothetical protein